MRRKIFGSLVMASALLLASCNSNDNDNVAPEITIISPANEEGVHLGDVLKIKLNFSDNEELASYKLNIHYNDGHTHTKQNIEEVRFVYDKEFNDIIGKKNAEVEVEVQIPKVDNATGNPIKKGGYHLGVYCLDASKNESVKFIEIDLID